MSANRSTAGDIGRLWLPTAVSTSMLTLEIPLLLALAARIGDHVVAVAGLGLALAIIVPVNAAALALATPSAVAATKGWDRRTMRTYMLLVGAVGCAVLAVVWSGWIDRPIEAVLGVESATWDAARHALQGLALAPLLVGVRRYNQGYLIAAGDTKWFLPATLARMITSVLLAATFTAAWDAGTLGIGLALMLGVALEAGLLSWRSRGATAPARGAAARRGMRAIARVHAPLTGAMLLTVLPPTAILLALSAAGGGPEVLAAWPVLYGLAWLICGTTTDLEAITAANYAASPGATRRFAIALGGGLTSIWCIVELNPVADAYLRDFSGLSPGTTSAALTGIAALLPLAFLCAVREWLRGALVARDRARQTLAGVGVGFGFMLAAFLMADAVGAGLIKAAAASVSAGAAAEVLALALLASGRLRAGSRARRRGRAVWFALKPLRTGRVALARLAGRDP
jgi:progressive ankylosis protein